jgi:DNA-binding CsgD family transcriptional regulator
MSFLGGKKEYILEQRRFGIPRAKIALKLGVSPSLMYKYLTKLKKK